jgi:tRNA (guanine-N7-)-methyltransferase
MTSISKDTLPESRPHRSIRSFIIREGRLTRGQQQALDRLLPEFGLSVDQFPDNSFRPAEIFGRKIAITMEIGFGDGEALLDVAKKNPDNGFIGVEVHRPGVGHLLLEAEKRTLANVRVFNDDAVDVLSSAIGDQTIDKICLFFPDPWPKKKHNKRRILQSDFLDQVIRVLKVGGEFHFASDWQPYAEEALQKLNSISRLQNLAEDSLYSERPSDRPMTKFERRGLKLGHGVWDIRMIKL